MTSPGRTTYIILGRVEAVSAYNGDEVNPAEPEEPFEAFRKIGAVNAHSVDQALRKGAEQYGGGYLVAVSERHWRSGEFEVETVTRVKVKSA